ncbi:MAG TPA: hypothetical protein VM118_08405 [Acidobacteriota bacterium]|nr:hypothetical protein [Acidobacteriota bacterium]
MSDALARSAVLLLKTIIVLSLLLAVGTARAQSDPVGNHGLPRAVSDPPSLWHRSAAGVLLGPWFAGDFGKDLTGAGSNFKGNETGFHFEFFFNPHLTGVTYADLSLGAISRGQMRISQYPDTDSALSYYGDVTLYPIGLGVMIAPFAKNTGMRLQPMIRAGGSVLILTQRGETTRLSDYAYAVDTDTHVEIGYYAGAGLSWILGHQVMLLGGVKYQHAEFNTDLLAGGNYSGIQVLFGAAYLYR